MVWVSLSQGVRKVRTECGLGLVVTEGEKGEKCQRE